MTLSVLLPAGVHSSVDAEMMHPQIGASRGQFVGAKGSPSPLLQTGL